MNTHPQNTTHIIRSAEGLGIHHSHVCPADTENLLTTAFSTARAAAEKLTPAERSALLESFLIHTVAVKIALTFLSAADDPHTQHANQFITDVFTGAGLTLHTSTKA